MAALFASCALQTHAGARPEYHAAIVAGTGTCHDCRLCHSESVGMRRNLDATKPFVGTMAGHLGQLPPEMADSDGDGETDLAELKQQGDPNDPMLGSGEYQCPELLEYGCIGAVPASGDAPTPTMSSIARSRPNAEGFCFSIIAAALGLRLWMNRRRG